MDAFWSVAAMPIGVFLCFTPIVIAWALEGMKKNNSPSAQNRERR